MKYILPIQDKGEVEQENIALKDANEVLKASLRSTKEQLAETQALLWATESRLQQELADRGYNQSKDRTTRELAETREWENENNTGLISRVIDWGISKLLRSV